MGPVGDVVVEVETDAGITGVGAGNWATGAISTIVDETLSKLIVGEDPTERERLWDMMYRATIPFGRKGAAIEAISAVDLALWDIAGKEADKPVYKLLGGPTKDEIPGVRQQSPPGRPREARRRSDPVRRGGLRSDETPLPLRARGRSEGNGRERGHRRDRS